MTLLVNQQLRVTDDVDKQDVSDLELHLSGWLRWCGIHFGFSSQSFWKRGSFRSGSNMGSSRRRAGVSGAFSASTPMYGIESSFCKAAMARSGSPICAATRARISIGLGPDNASFS